MMKQAALLIEKAINAYLSLDPESKIHLKKLHGNIIHLELLPFHFLLQMQIECDTIVIKTNELDLPQTTIRGTPLQLVGVVLDKNNRKRFFAEDVMIEGDAEVGQQVIELFDRLQIDWEEHLANLVGDAPAHHTTRIINNIGHWIKKTSQSFAQDVTDYIHEERNWLPTREALQDLFADIDALRMDVDRAEVKMKFLQEHEEKL